MAGAASPRLAHSRRGVLAASARASAASRHPWLRRPAESARRGLAALIFLACAFPALGAGDAGFQADFKAEDCPNDAGKAILLTWKPSPGDGPDRHVLIEAAEAPEGPWVEAARLPSTIWYAEDLPQRFGAWRADRSRHAYEVQQVPAPPGSPEGAPKRAIEPGKTWHFRLSRVDAGGPPVRLGTASAQARGNLFNTTWLNVAVFITAFAALLLAMIGRARRNPSMFVRRIPGLDAVDEAIGRATEMGKPVLYLNGLLGMDSLSTIASTSILGRMARKIADYDSKLLVPCFDPIVMTVSQEVVREAYLEAGRPDAYKADDLFYVTNDQFGYVAAVDGIMLRDRPAACLYMGYYYAESLLLAETGASTGAIQIAATDAVTQIPFFIAACDYTLIGEELYAASAYLSREPNQLGSLKAQDIGKATLLVLLVAGAALATLGAPWILDAVRTFS